MEATALYTTLTVQIDGVKEGKREYQWGEEEPLRRLRARGGGSCIRAEVRIANGDITSSVKSLWRIFTYALQQDFAREGTVR